MCASIDARFDRRSFFLVQVALRIRARMQGASTIMHGAFYARLGCGTPTVKAPLVADLVSSVRDCSADIAINAAEGDHRSRH
jgi:hypothetical protein